MSFLFFFFSLLSAAAAAEAVRRRLGLRTAVKAGAVFFAVMSVLGAVWTGADAASGCAAAVCVLSVGTLLEFARRVPAEAVWLTAALSVGLGVAAPVFALAVLAAVLLRESAALLLERVARRWQRRVCSSGKNWGNCQPAAVHS